MDTPKKGLPLVTVLVCIICVGVYWQQYRQDDKYFTALDDFCSREVSREIIDALRRAIHVKSGNPCFEVFEAVRDTSGPMLTLQLLAVNALPTGFFANRNEESNHTFNSLQAAYLQFDMAVPMPLTRHLRFDPKNPDFLKMFTATFSHGDWMHLASNLLFFSFLLGPWSW